MRRSVALVSVALAAAAALLSGCQTGTGSDPNDPDQVEVVTWWTTGADQSALYDLVHVFGSQHPKVEFIDASVRDQTGAAARAAIASRFEAGNPPDAILAVAGGGLTDYVADRKLVALNSLYADAGLDGAFSTELLDLLKVDGKLYSVPSSLHRANVLWSNSAVLKTAGIDPSNAPADLDTWLADLEHVRASGIEYPLALGDASTQTQLFENVLLADLGPEQYRALFLVGDGWHTGAVADAVADYSRLIDFADPAGRARGASATGDTVVYGGAAYLVLDDSVLPRFQGVGYVLGDQFHAAPSPGTAGSFDLIADSFAIPAGADHDTAARDWLLTAASAEGQRALSLANGSIPARSDADTADYPPYQQTAIESLHRDSVVPSLAHGVAASPAWTRAITTAIARFGHDRRPEALVNALQTAAAAALGTSSP